MIKNIVFYIFILMWVVFTVSDVAAAAASKGQNDDSKTILNTVIIITMSGCCSQDAWPEAEKAIEREFSTIGINVINVPGTAADLNEQLIELDSVSEKYKAAAAIRVVKESTGNSFSVNLWIKDRVTLKTTLRTLKIRTDTSIDPTLILGVKTVELFRASLHEVELNTALTSAVSPPGKIEKIVNTTKKQHRELPVNMQLSIMGLIGNSATNIGPAGGAGGGLGIDIYKRLRITAETAFFVWSNNLKTESLKSDLNYFKFRLATLVTLFSHKNFRLRAGADAGVVVAKIKGIHSDKFTLNKEQSTAGLIGISVSAEYSFTKRVAVFSGVALDFMFNSIELLHGDVAAALFGPVLFEGNTGIIVNFF
jgi:hypothetical protein